MQTWQLQEAKSKFSQVVELALSQGPQSVTKHGVESVVILSRSLYDSLTQTPKTPFEILQNAPKVDLVLEREQDTVRSLEF